MALDGVIDAIVYGKDMDTVYIRPRIDSDGQKTIAGRRRVFLARNPDYTPHPGDEIWGDGAVAIVSKNGVDHKYLRISRQWDGTYRTWMGPYVTSEKGK